MKQKRVLTIALVLMAGLFSLASCGKEETKTVPAQQQSIVQMDSQKTGRMLLAQAKEKLSEAKTKLAGEGKYDCCMEDACDYCAVHEGSCGCAQDVKKGEHICIECYAGWQQGKGDVPNVKKENVKTDFVMHEHMHE